MRKIQLVLLMMLISGSAYAGNFHDNADGTVTDLSTNLMWQKCSAGLSGRNCTKGTAKEYAWDDAKNYCESLTLGGFKSWRLPSIKELESLFDSSKSLAPAIDVTYFPKTEILFYWSADTSTRKKKLFIETCSWSLSFFYDIFQKKPKTYGCFPSTASNSVRCVRSR